MANRIGDCIGASLEDMSSGTTMLLGPNLDDLGSFVADIGFDFWFDGVKYNQATNKAAPGRIASHSQRQPVRGPRETFSIIFLL